MLGGRPLGTWLGRLGQKRHEQFQVSLGDVGTGHALVERCEKLLPLCLRRWGAADFGALPLEAD